MFVQILFVIKLLEIIKTVGYIHNYFALRWALLKTAENVRKNMHIVFFACNKITAL